MQLEQKSQHRFLPRRRFELPTSRRTVQHAYHYFLYVVNVQGMIAKVVNVSMSTELQFPFILANDSTEFVTMGAGFTLNRHIPEYKNNAFVS